MKKTLNNKTNVLPTAHCPLPIAHCQLRTANCFLPIALCLLLIALCMLPIAPFAQNTFRYTVCPDVGPLPRWNLSEDISIHQVPSDSGYLAFSTAARDIVVATDTPNDSLDWSCFGATKLDKYGNLEWIRTYQEKSGLTHKYPHDGIATADSGFIMAGEKTTPGNPTSTGTNSYVQKMDKSGHLTWAIVYKVGNTNDNKALKILQMPDGGYIVMGQTKDVTYSDTWHDSYNTYLLRLDKDGDRLWCNYYDAKKNGEEHPASLDLTNDGGFIIGGAASVDPGYGFDQHSLMSGYKAFMMKVSADGQTIEWARRYGAVNDHAEQFYDVKQTGDGGYISVGETDVNFVTKGWVVKTNAQGIIEWQKTYDTWSKIDKVEIVNNGYILGSTESYSGNSEAGNHYGRLSKINTSGDVQWSKLYDSGITDLNLTKDNGFVMAVSTPRSAEGKNFMKGVMKTNASGEFDNGCIYNGALSSWTFSRADTVYGLTSSVNVALTPSNLVMKEVTVTGRQTCPVLCNISTKPIPPDYIYAGTACVNTDAPVLINPWSGGSMLTNFSHYKVDFGDPASGDKNISIGSSMTITGSSMSDYAQVLHNYSNPGSYTITMTVYNGDYSESDTVSTHVVVVPALKLSYVTPEINVCKQDTVSITAKINNYVQGEYTSYWKEQNYIFNGPTSIVSQSSFQQDSTLTITAIVVADTSQDYYVMISRDAWTFGCVVSDTVRVKLGDNKAIITGNTQICSGATTTLEASGGNGYLWSTGATTKTISVNPSTNKTYWVEATSTDACRDTAFVYVKVVPDINVEVFADRKSVCTGDTVKLYATGAGSYSWNNGSTGDTIKVAAAVGSNTFIVTGKSGSCVKTASIVIKGDNKPVGSISGPSKACLGSEFIVTASGGDRYDWPSSNNDRSNPVQKGRMVGVSYDRTVFVYKGGCAVSVDCSIPYAAAPSIGGIKPVECRVCPGTKATLRKYFYPTPGYTDQNPGDDSNNQNLTYLWSTGETGSNLNDSIHVTVNHDTIITLTTTNSNGCSVTHSTALYATPHFYIKKQISPAVSCNRTSTKLYIMGDPLLNLNYTWSNGSTTDTLVVSPLQDTMYYVTATVNGCTRKDSVWVKAKSNLPKAWINGDSIVCKGGQGTYTAKGNITPVNYKWETGNAADTQSSLTIPNITGAATLKAYVTFAGGCGDTAEYKITVTDPPHALITGDTVICPGGKTSLKASGGNTYRWSTTETSPNINVTANTDTPMSLYAFAGNCKDSTRVTIKTNQLMTATLISDEVTTCTGTPLTLIAGGGDHYTWNTGDDNDMLGILPAVTTSYTVVVTTDDNCKDTKSITIRVSPAPNAQISSAGVCQGDILTLTASGGDTYLWSTGDVAPFLTIKNPKADSIYKVKVFVGSCLDSTQAQVSILPRPLVDAGTDVSINYGNSVPVFATGSSIGGGTYQWNPASGLSCTDCASPLAEPSSSTLYYITLKDINGCKSTDSVMVFVDLPCGDAFVPSAFSPNNDGNNNILFVRGRCIQNMSFKIYDRWGEKVFESTNTTKGWDGTYNDKPMNSDLFVYSLEAILTNGEPLNRKGTIMLMR